MLRSLLVLFFILSSTALSFDHAESYLPRGGQSVDVFSGDLATRIGRVRVEIRQDESVYTLRGNDIPTIHFLSEEQRFSVPGVAATEKAQTFDERGALRSVYHGVQSEGAMEKQARIELVKFDEGRCQLSWKLSVSHRGRMLRDQQGSMAYDCPDPVRVIPQRQPPREQTVFPGP